MTHAWDLLGLGNYGSRAGTGYAVSGYADIVLVLFMSCSGYGGSGLGSTGNGVTGIS